MEQMKVIIAEDEPIVARYMKGILESLGGFLVAAVCENGEDAIVQCKKENPHLLITDIKMPGISGLELIRRVKGQGVEIQTIIISGFKNFDYAKEAIALGVEDYITKPINLEELKKTLLRIRADYEKEHSIARGFEMEKAMRNLDEAYFRKQFPYEQFRLLLVYQSGEAEDMDCKIPYDEECMSFFYRNALFVVDGGKEQSSLERMRRIIKEVTLSKKRKKTCMVMLIRKMDASRDSFRSFRRLHRILRECTVPGKLIFKEYETPEEIPRQVEFFDEDLLKKLEIKIEAKEWQAVTGKLRELFDFWEKNRYPLYRMKTGIHRVSDRLQKAGAFSSEKIFVNEYLDDCIRYTDGYQEMKEAVCSYLEEELRAKYHFQQEGKSYGQLFEEIRQFVLENEEQNFSLNEVSSLFGVSQPFIRKIFRMHVGQSYNEWVLSMKIERAKELMRANPKLLIKDVAEKIGYEQLYFSTVFNKYVGMSPSEYKFQNHGETEV